MTFLTNLIFEPKGRHDVSSAYKIKDTVMSEDGSQVYFALQDVPAGTALTDEDFWKLQIDLSAAKSAMEDALVSFGNYAKSIGTRVKGETARASGNPVTCLADAGSLLMPVTALEPKQAGSGDPSPDNIRPISGWDAVNLNAAGKNLLPDFVSAGTVNGVTVTKNADGSCRINGTAAGAVLVSLANANNKVDILTGRYTVSLGTALPNGVTARAEAYDKTTLKWFKTYGNIPAANGEYTINIDGAYYTTLLISIPSGAVVDLTIYPMIRLASITDATYEPYQGKLHTVQIGQTVYGGKMDWLTGKLVAEFGLYTLTGTGSAKLISASVHNAKCFMTDVIPDAVGDSTILNGAKSSHFVEGVWNDIVNMTSPLGKFAINTSKKIGIAYDGTIDEANAWLAAQNAAGTPVQFAYKLATPIEIQLTPHIISAVDPEQTNTLYGDGSVDVEYVKPLHVSIEERVAAAMQTN